MRVQKRRSKMTTARKPISSPFRMRPLMLALSLMGASASARADAVSDLKAQVDALQRKVVEMEEAGRNADAQNGQRAAAQISPGYSDGAGATKGSFKFPGTDTTITIGGYVKLEGV